MSRRPRAGVTAASRSPAAVRSPAAGDALLRARRTFALGRRTHLRLAITTIVMTVIGVGCLIVLVTQLHSQHPLWPWIAGAVVAGVIGLHAFATQGRLEDCPHCRASLRGYAARCPWCGAGIGEGDGSCPSCLASFAAPPVLKTIHFCSSCGTEVVAPSLKA